MAHKVTHLRVFVASPSDVQEERDAVEGVVSEVNRNLARSLGLQLDLVRWETDVTPGFGKDPQDVINKQINDNYDIFIGIIWSRIGTPTPRAGSGTLEEFERAYARHRGDSESIDLLIYFKESPVLVSSIDPEQLTKINAFRASLGEKGGVYWTFDGSRDFETTLRAHLSMVIQRWEPKNDTRDRLAVSSNGESRDRPISVTTLERVEARDAADEAIIHIDEEDEYGLFDYADLSNSRFAEMTEAMEAIRKATARVGEDIDRQANVITAANKNPDSAQIYPVLKKAFRFVSEHFESYSNVLDENVQIMSKSADAAFDALSRFVVIFADSYPDSANVLESQEGAILALLEAKTVAYLAMTQMLDSINTFPRYTGQFNRSRRRLANSLSSLLRILDNIEETAITLLNTINQLKSKK